MNESQMGLEALNEALWQAVSTRPNKVTGTYVDIADPIPTKKIIGESRFNNRFPVLDYLETAIDLARASDLTDIVDQFAKVAWDLPWSQNASYTEENCEPAFLAGYAYAGISGPEGPIVCAAPRGGLFLLGPSVTYPAHNHAPKEVYLVLTPGAQWQLDEGDWFKVSPGDLIFHDTLQMHAMKTGSQPMLAFAGWIEPGDRRSIGFNKSAT